MEYTRIINTIHNSIINYFQEPIKNISSNTINKKYILDIGSILYKDGRKNNNYTLYPYDIYIKKGTCDEMYYKAAITYGEEEDSLNYISKFFPKYPVKIKKGVILMGKGKFIEDKDDIETCKDNMNFMVWNTNLDIQTLKDKVQLEPYKYHQTDNIHNVVDEIYKKYNIYLEKHHVDNNPNNENRGNILMVTKEQHASIHLFMWDHYFMENNFLKNFKRKTHFV